MNDVRYFLTCLTNISQSHHIYSLIQFLDGFDSLSLENENSTEESSDLASLNQIVKKCGKTADQQLPFKQFESAVCYIDFISSVHQYV